MAIAYGRFLVLGILCILQTAFCCEAESCYSQSLSVNDNVMLQTKSLKHSSNATTSMVYVALSWETGTVDSGLAMPLKPSFSENKNGWTPPKDPQSDDCKNGKMSERNCWPKSIGKNFVGSRLHYLSVEKVSWARDGDHVLKVYADGRNWDKSGDYAFRSELSAVQDKYMFHEGEYQYFTMNFWLDKSWDQVAKWSTLIAQWKMSPGHPHAAVRLSNEGDYKVYFKGDKLWKHTGEMDTRHGGRFLGVAKPQAWNEIKIFFKKSRGRDGIANVWFNGELVFDHRGKTLLKSGRGYTKFGMYTCIMGERIIYFDAVDFCHSADREECLGGTSMEQWIANGKELPPPSQSPEPSPRPSPLPLPRPFPRPSQRPSPQPSPRPSDDESWTVVQNKKARCRNDKRRVNSPSSLDQCKQDCVADGANTFNARSKSGQLRTCYCLSCKPEEADGKLFSPSSSGSERWQAYMLSSSSESSGAESDAFPKDAQSSYQAWKVVQDKKARCREGKRRIRFPSSLDQCKKDCVADGANTFNARSKSGDLRTCYCLSCKPEETDGKLLTRQRSGSERWQVYMSR